MITAIDIEKVIKEVSANTGVDEQDVAIICKHVFGELVRIMKDDEDKRDILFNHLMKFKLKTRYKEDKTKKYTAK